MLTTFGFLLTPDKSVSTTPVKNVCRNNVKLNYGKVYFLDYRALEIEDYIYEEIWA